MRVCAQLACELLRRDMGFLRCVCVVTNCSQRCAAIVFGLHVTALEWYFRCVQRLDAAQQGFWHICRKIGSDIGTAGANTGCIQEEHPHQKRSTERQRKVRRDTRVELPRLAQKQKNIFVYVDERQQV